MKTLGRYVFGSFLSSFVLAFWVLSFVLTVGLMVQIVGYILDGVPMYLVARFAAVSFPETLQWTMPLALLVASVLVFSRLSADSEIAAMRACGVNLFSVMLRPIVFAIACTLIGFFVNNEVVPRGHEIRRSLKSKVSVDVGLEVLQPGKLIDDFPNVKLYFARKEGNWLYDIVAMDYNDPRFVRTMTASKARVSSVERDVRLELYNFTVDPVDADHSGSMSSSRCEYVIKNALSSGTYRKGCKDYRFFELIDRVKELTRELDSLSGEGENIIAQRKLLRKVIANLKTEFMKRFVFALASICFVLVGIPLGIKSQRKESTIGMAISLIVAMGYYLITILALSLDNNYSAHPELLILLSPILSAIVASKLLSRNL